METRWGFGGEITAMTTILIDWGDRPDTRPAVRIRTRRAMLLPGPDGAVGHTDAGTEIELPAATLDQLSSDDVEFIGPAPDELAFDI